jgi:hypothetical protein
MTTSRFAEGTAVPSEKTRGELERLLVQHGAHQIVVAVDHAERRAVVVFGLVGRRIKLHVSTAPKQEATPGKRDWEHAKGVAPRGWNTWSTERQKQWVAEQRAQFERSAWRRLLLVVKAKLELVRDADSTVEREFLADILLPNGETVHEALGPQLEDSYRTGGMPPLLPPAGGT